MRNNRPSNNQQNYRDDYQNNYNLSRNSDYYPRHYQKKSAKWIWILLGIVGGAGASVGTMLYLNKAHDTPTEAAQAVAQPSTAPQPLQPVVSAQAKIMSVTPNYSMVDKPVKSCQMVESQVTVPNPNKSTATGTAVGGATGALAGGIIGNQIKQGGGGTIIGGVLGAATGAIIGHEVQKANQPAYITKTENVKVCDTVTKSVKEVISYDIQYQYNGQVQTATTKKKYKVGEMVSYNKLQANFIK